MTVLQSIWHVWVSTQVELKGRYSVERMHAFKRYSAETSYKYAIMVILATPLPCLLVSIMTDAVPLTPPSGGMRSSAIVWARAFFIVLVMTWTQMDQCRRFVNNLPQPLSFTITATVFITTVTVLGLIMLGFVIGYPVPFAMTIGAPGWLVGYFVIFGLKFGRFIMHNKDVRYDFLRFTAIMAVEVSMAIIYPVYSVAFHALHSYAQEAFTLVLPMIKLALKVIFHWLLRKHEDLLPEVVIFNIEIYHSLFVACYMQNSTSLRTSFILMAVNSGRAALAIYDVTRVLARIESYCQGMPSMSRASKPDLVEVVGYILKNTANVRRHSSIRLRSEHRSSRTSRTASKISPARVSRLAKFVAILVPRHRNQQNSVAVAQIGAIRTSSAGFEVRHLSCAVEADDKKFLDALSENDKALVAADILQVLHLTEFITLIGFAEVMVPVLYTVYLYVVYHFPNREYYSQMRDISEAELNETIRNVLIYVLLEFVPLSIVAWILHKKLRVSTVKQVAFILQTEWVDVQSRLLFWVCYLLQGLLLQFEADYTLKFAWLKSGKKT